MELDSTIGLLIPILFVLPRAVIIVIKVGKEAENSCDPSIKPEADRNKEVVGFRPRLVVSEEIVFHHECVCASPVAILSYWPI